MDKLIVDGLTRFDSSRIDKILENAVLAGNSDLIEKLLGFSNLVLNTAQKEALSKLDFLPTILLYGPPNTGKTTSTYSLFKKIKLEISNSANLYVLSVASITSSEYGVTSKNIVAAFDELKK